MPVFLLSNEIMFPPPFLARKDGLLAMGGDLALERLLLAYRMGIFPWYVDGEPILWWSPDPRLVLDPKDLHVSRSLARLIKRKEFQVSMDTAFCEVIRGCADVRVEKGEGTWLTHEMINAYQRLHEEGFAHSVEAWYEGELAGGIYGVSLGSAFFGESMFTRVSNASKVAFVALAQHLFAERFHLLDCQVSTEHLLRFGAREIPRDLFLARLDHSLSQPTRKGKWEFKDG